MGSSTTKRQDALTEARRIKADPALRKLTEVVCTFRELQGELPMQQAHILLLIAQHPGITQAEIAGTVGLAQSSVSRNIHALSDRHREGFAGLGLVEPQFNPFDHRAVLYYLTEAGRGCVKRLLEGMRLEPPEGSKRRTFGQSRKRGSKAAPSVGV